MYQKNRSQLRVERYYRRQHPDRPAWGADYQPAIRAVREEAPARSRPSIITGRNKVGRPLHLLSLPERNAMLLALYNPAVFDVHEQRLLDPEPAPHPLQGHRSAPQLLRPVPGTWAVANRLGLTRYHPRCSVMDPLDPGGRRLSIPHPLVGDLLLFVESGERGFCVNWSIKAKTSQFNRAFTSYSERTPDRAAARVVARHSIEREYYLAAGIRTVEISGESMPPALVGNLSDLFAAQCDSVLPEKIRKSLVNRVREIVGTEITPAELLAEFSYRLGIGFEQFRAGVFSAIWRREIRVDLFTRILFDRPLRPETSDPLDRYADWFREVAAV